MNNPLPAQIHVFPEGADTNPGTQAAPFATISQAREAVRGKAKQGKEPVIVVIHGGEFLLEETVVFGPEDSGTEDAPVRYIAAKGETPVFTAGRKITGWFKPEQFPLNLPEAAREHVMAARLNLPSLKSLYDGERRLPVAESDRGIKVDGERVVEDNNEQPKRLGHLADQTEPLVFSRELPVENPNELTPYADATGLEVYYKPGYPWLINICEIAEVDAEEGVVSLAVDPSFNVGEHARFKIRNAPVDLDSPGEWVYDPATGTLYLWPDKPLEQMEVRTPVLQEFFRIEGQSEGEKVRFLEFDGLTFKHGERDTWKEGDIGLQHDWEMWDKGNALVRFRNAEDCAIRRCRFRASSGTGIRLDLHARRIIVESNHIHDIGGSGIVLSGYGPGTTDVNHHNTIHNNHIDKVGQMYDHSPGIFISQSGHNQVTHNTIHELHYNGMVISGPRPEHLMSYRALRNRREWQGSFRMDELIADLGKRPDSRDIQDYLPYLHARENNVSRNRIFRTMLTMGDGNGIYHSAMGANNRCEENFLHNIYHSTGAIRLDDDSTFTHINRNVIMNCNLGFITKGPYEMQNNFLINVDEVFRHGHQDWVRGIVYIDDDRENTAYIHQRRNKPEPLPWFEWFEHVKNVLYYGPDQPSRDLLGHDLTTGEAVEPGAEEVGVLFADPRFDKDGFSQGRFTFLPGSPATALGIVPLDLSDAGSNLESAQQAHHQAFEPQ